jgi:type IV secretory pathway component VirB8
MSINQALEKSYFKAGEDWYFDRYQVAQRQANSYLVLLLLTQVIVIVLIIAITALLPLKTLTPIIIHKNSVTGETWVAQPKTPYAPENDKEVQADIVRYLTAMLSYTAADINQRYQLVLQLSADNVQKQYAVRESNDNPDSPVNRLGESGTRIVKVEDIVFLDKAGTHEIREKAVPSHNLAKVDLITETIDKAGNKKIEPWVATIAWIYKGTPDSQVEAWSNWNGFTVTSFRLDSKNITHH